MCYSKWFFIILFLGLVLPTSLFAQDDNVDWGIAINNVRYKPDNEKVTFIFDASFSDFVEGDEALFGVKAYINPEKIDEFDYITERCRLLNEEFENVLSDVKKVIEQKVYKDVVVTIPNSVIMRAIGQPGQFNVSFIVCVVVVCEDYDSYMQCHLKPFSYIYTIKP